MGSSPTKLEGSLRSPDISTSPQEEEDPGISEDVGTRQTDGKPSPRPPTCSRQELLNGTDFSFIDECALQVPPELLLRGFWDIVEYLVVTPSGTVLDDLSKVRILFRWMTSYDVYNLTTDIIPPEDSPLEYFMKIQYGLGDYANMFFCLCQIADVPCVIINGLTKSSSYEIGAKVDKHTLKSRWNAVFIQNNWWPIDPLWASVCVTNKKSGHKLTVDPNGKFIRMSEFENTKDSKINEFFFLTEPTHLITTHFPDCDEWQLLPVSVSKEDFEAMAYVREQYHMLGLQLNECCNACVLRSNGEDLEIKLLLPPEISASVKFKYSFVQSRKQAGSEKCLDLILERFVFVEHKTDSLTIKLRFPLTGKFIFDLYCINWTNSDMTYELVVSYAILCKKKKSNNLPFPDTPELGWGRNPYSEQLGIVPVVPSDTFLATTDSHCKAVVKIPPNYRTGHILRNVLMDDAILSRYSVAYYEPEEELYTVLIRLPKEGDFALKIYAQDCTSTNDNNTEILTFCIHFEPTRPSQKSLPFPHVAMNHLGRNVGACHDTVSALTYKQHFVDVLEGQASFVFKSSPSLHLLCELSSSQHDASMRMSTVTKHENDRWIFELDLPVVAEYSLNVFAMDKSEGSDLECVHSYLIKSKGRPIKFVKFEDDDVLDGIISESMKFNQPKLCIPIPAPSEDEVIFATIDRRDGKENVESQKANVEISHENLNVIFPESGEYMVDVYEKDVDGSLNCIARFTFSRAEYFKTYTDDIEGLLKMLKPSVEKQKREKNNKHASLEKRAKQIANIKKKIKDIRKKNKLARGKIKDKNHEEDEMNSRQNSHSPNVDNERINEGPDIKSNSVQDNLEANHDTNNESDNNKRDSINKNEFLIQNTNEEDKNGINHDDLVQPSHSSQDETHTQVQSVKSKTNAKTDQRPHKNSLTDSKLSDNNITEISRRHSVNIPNVQSKVKKSQRKSENVNKARKEGEGHSISLGAFKNSDSPRKKCQADDKNCDDGNDVDDGDANLKNDLTTANEEEDTVMHRRLSSDDKEESLGGESGEEEEDCEDSYCEELVFQEEEEDLHQDQLDKELKREVCLKKNELRNALKSKDVRLISEKLQNLKRNTIDITGDEETSKLIESAMLSMTQMKAKQNLMEACQVREKAVLVKALHRAKKANHKKSLNIQIIIATKVLKRLQKIEKISNYLLQLDQNMLTEMKKYQTPPKGVYEALLSTFIILGENPAGLQSWRCCQALLFKTGKENIMRRVRFFDPAMVSMETAKLARSILAPYTVVQIRDVSKGAAAFYTWTKGMLENIFFKSDDDASTTKVRSQTAKSFPRPTTMEASKKHDDIEDHTVLL